MTKIDGRTFAKIGAASGAVVSIAANVAHSFIPPDGAPADWSPRAGAVASAVFWPVALYLAIEVLTRSGAPSRWWWALARYAGLLPVGAVAAVVSYRHLSGLLDYYGEDGFTRTFGPLAVDGLMIICAVVLVDAGRVAVVSGAVPVTGSTVATLEPVTVATVPSPSVATVLDECRDSDRPTVATVTAASVATVTGDSDATAPAAVAATADPVTVAVSRDSDATAEAPSQAPAGDDLAAAREWLLTERSAGRRPTVEDITTRYSRPNRWAQRRLQELDEQPALRAVVGQQ